jgi:hypothetical protein
MDLSIPMAAISWTRTVMPSLGLVSTGQDLVKLIAFHKLVLD